MPINIPQIMGNSLKSLRVLKDVKKLSVQSGTVLIYCEKGFCKELIAKAIHDNSPRREGPFVRVDLTSTPGHLAEKELF
jgi:DNA-binding NtrC family response regulator